MTSRAGSSPLARGLPPGPPPPARRLGIIPARAGFTPRRGGTRRAGRDHPRSRGVYGDETDDTIEPDGSSPLARGLLRPGHGRRSGWGIIPARAGFTIGAGASPRLTQDHPRSRGVYRSWPGWASRASWIIPARAGFTGPAHAAGGGSRDHPRSRGVYEGGPPYAGRALGSSPLARGLLRRSFSAREKGRIIPARAGFTSAEDRRTNELADHPRSRGVYWMSRSRLGSSLLVWCSFGQVVMGGRAGRLLTPSVLLSAWSMSVRCRSEVWDR